MDHAVLRSPVLPFETVYRRLFATDNTETISKTTEDVPIFTRPTKHGCLRALVMRQTVHGDIHPRSNVQLHIPDARPCVSDDGI